jgi:TRAP-type C4-dicarboxylate transport system substrate-binding protein
VDELRKAGMNVVASVDRAAFEQSLQSATAGFSARFGAETIRQIKSVR